MKCPVVMDVRRGSILETNLDVGNVRVGQWLWSAAIEPLLLRTRARPRDKKMSVSGHQVKRGGRLKFKAVGEGKNEF